MKRILALVVITSATAATALAGEIQAEARSNQKHVNLPTHRGNVLWDQSGIDTSANALVDQDFGDFPTYSSFHVTDVVSDGWTINSVETYFTIGFGAWPPDFDAVLNIIPGDGVNLPDNADDPSNGTVVSAFIAGDPNDVGANVVRAEGLDIAVPPGDWWIGLTPILNFGTFGQEFHYGAPIQNLNSAFRNPGGAFGFGPNWNNSYVIDTSGVWQDNLETSILILGSAGCDLDGCDLGDLNGDCEVSLEDLGLLLADFGTTYDLEDLSNLLSQFGNCCNAGGC